MAAASGGAGVLVVSAWVEAGDGEVRARIIRSVGVDANEQVTASASSIDEILDIVQDWLESLLDSEAGD